MLLIVAALATLIAAEEMYRPTLHYTPKKNWMGEPNGLYYSYEHYTYHMFYEYNPQGPESAHMSWGHAESKNLVDWEEREVAIPEYKNH